MGRKARMEGLVLEGGRVGDTSCSVTGQGRAQHLSGEEGQVAVSVNRTLRGFRSLGFLFLYEGSQRRERNSKMWA